jgi:hypothetical protein
MDLTPQGNQESQQRRNNAENKTHDSEIDISTAQQVEQPNANASTSERKNEKSFPRLRRLKPLIEAVGIVFLIIYTGVTIGLWCSSRDANKLSHEYFLKDQRPYMWPMNVPLTVKPAPILRPTRTPKSWLRPSAAVSPANTNNASWPTKVMESGVGPEALRTKLARMTPEDFGMKNTGGDAVLNRFQLSVLTEGSGTQIYSTTFVQWAARELLRRAQPLTLLARFAPRLREQSIKDLLAQERQRPLLDPQGSLRDADMGAYYTWLNQQRLSGADQSRTRRRHRPLLCQRLRRNLSLLPGLKSRVHYKQSMST